MSVQYEYDDLGKIVSRSYGNGVVESIDYNLQGWRITQEVNRSGECLFREALKYYDVGTNATPSFAGRLTGRAVMNNGSYYYEYYSYDALGRLLGGGKESNISYDLNGNILGLTRSLTGTTPSQMTWSYDGNKRHGYYYDNEGNIVSLNNVNSISYNWLGLPSSVVFGSAVMNYKYLSDGTKLSCTDNANTGYVYLGSRRYNKNSQSLILESIASSGGRISKNSTGSYLANYYTCDYLGNVRIVTDGGGNVLFKSDYTPFGMPYNVSGVSPDYTLSSKERQSLGGFIDFGARFYYPGGALWLRQDPQTDNNTEVSPYAYCANNPLLYVDPSGNIWETVWDVISLTTGVKSFSDNVKQGNTGAAILDGLGVLADAAAVVMPFVPGGVSNVIKGARALNKGYDSARVARIANSAMPEQCKRGLITETLLLAEKGFKKNTEKFVTFAKGEYLGVVPDIFDKQKGIIGEIKDVSKLGDLKQIEGEINLAQQKGYRFILFVEKDAKLSPKLLDTIKSYPKASIKTFSRDELWKMLE